MDHSRLAGILCLLLLLVCGCSDPGYELRRAAYDGNAATVEKILKAHPEVINAREKPMPVVVVAPGAARGSTEWVDTLFATKDSEFDEMNRHGMTPLHMAVIKEREEMVKLLLSHKADVNATNFYGFPPLFEATWRNRKPALITLLVDAKADLNFKNIYLGPPLNWAAMYGNTNAAELFLKRGAQVNGKDFRGMTPLHHAALGKTEPMVRLLLLHKAPINDQDARGNTPLIQAASRGHPNIIKLLLENGADVNAVNNERASPLFVLVQDNPFQYKTGRPQEIVQEQLALIDFLVTKKAQVHVTNLFGKTLFQEALRLGDTNVINRLRQHGAEE